MEDIENDEKERNGFFAGACDGSDRHRIYHASRAGRTEEHVNQAWSHLLDAIHYLSFVKGDKTQLEKLVSLAEGLKAEDFTKASFKKMSDALEVAQEILHDDDALEVEIQKSYDALNQALLALERLVDKTSLETVITKAADVERNLNLYMTEGKEAFTKALAAARTIAADADASQGTVDQAATALADALANLRKLADKTQQEELLREANAKDLSGYTASSTAQFREERNLLDTLVNRAEVSEEEAQSAVKAYLIAEGNLKLTDTSKKSSGRSTSETALSNAYAASDIVSAVPASPVEAVDRSMLSDTTLPLTVKRGSAYCFKITVVSGNNAAPDFTVGNGSVLKTQFVAKAGNDYYYRVWAIGAPGESAGVYTRMPNEAPPRQCVVTIA